MSLSLKRPTRRPVARIAKVRHTDVTREEFNQMVDRLNERAAILDRVVRDLEVQFTRIAQLQLALDHITGVVIRRPRIKAGGPVIGVASDPRLLHARISHRPAANDRG
jgi:hypothetical protein